MKNRLLIYLLFLLPFFGCTQENITINNGASTIGINDGSPSNITINGVRITNFVFSGESNSGSEAPNSSATPTELSVRPILQMFNNTNLLFEDLHIGTNNLIGHINMTSPTTRHAWELEIANLVASGTLNNPTNVIKTGQGGSTIAMWAVGGNISGTIGCPGGNNPCNVSPWTIFMQRVDSAMRILNPTGTKFALLYTQGINDGLASTNINTWKTATIAHFAKIRARYGMVPIVMTKIMDNVSTQPWVTTFNAAIEEVCQQVDWCWFVDVTGAGLQNNFHWNYAGQKLILNRMITKLTEKGFTFKP